MKKLITSFEEYLSEQTFHQEPSNLYEPINYVFSLGGKHIRPLLLLLANEMFADNTEEALPAAYAIELFHNFSLLHDDIMDEAPLRRGKPAVHIKYGVNTGILSGDVMLVYVYKYLMECPNALQVMTHFNRIAIEVCEGQQYDMDFETKQLVAIDDYLKMIELKTAALIGGALQLGSLIGNAPEHDVTKLGLFGRKIGIAFQLQDDILDTFGNPAKFGKKTGGDIVQNKKTFLILKALEIADISTREILFDLYTQNSSDEQSKIEQVKQILRQLSVRQEAEHVMEQYYQEAMQHLHAVQVEEKKKASLYLLAKQLMNREE